jgi:hypothetical protein
MRAKNRILLDPYLNFPPVSLIGLNSYRFTSSFLVLAHPFQTFSNFHVPRVQIHPSGPSPPLPGLPTVALAVLFWAIHLYTVSVAIKSNKSNNNNRNMFNILKLFFLGLEHNRHEPRATGAAQARLLSRPGPSARPRPRPPTRPRLGCPGGEDAKHRGLRPWHLQLQGKGIENTGIQRVDVRTC